MSSETDQAIVDVVQEALKARRYQKAVVDFLNKYASPRDSVYTELVERCGLEYSYTEETWKISDAL